MNTFLSTAAAFASIVIFNTALVAFIALDAELYRRRNGKENS
jgi:hypothetical protein